jgi:hypothetical protein
MQILSIIIKNKDKQMFFLAVAIRMNSYKVVILA